MDHVIRALRSWLELHEEDTSEDRDYKAIRCIKNALRELNKYYDR